ncbi:hypothetical protein C7M84_011498 [Penaeus vannamei]|uniref:Uncharacterized protein n=1 Tax=Penaeus vannamei TaxID=6689 RepID=A0A3R7MUR6_PENVA|nr:hypothetical protein C7M84_011498 [Penaeus vannamei]
MPTRWTNTPTPREHNGRRSVKWKGGGEEAHGDDGLRWWIGRRCRASLGSDPQESKAIPAAGQPVTPKESSIPTPTPPTQGRLLRPFHTRRANAVKNSIACSFFRRPRRSPGQRGRHETVRWMPQDPKRNGTPPTRAARAPCASEAYVHRDPGGRGGAPRASRCTLAVDGEGGGRGIRTPRNNTQTLTQFLDEPEHDSADVEVALHPQDPLHLQVGHGDVQLPRPVTDQLTVRHHLEWRFVWTSLARKKISQDFVFLTPFPPFFPSAALARTHTHSNSIFLGVESRVNTTHKPTLAACICKGENHLPSQDAATPRHTRGLDIAWVTHSSFSRARLATRDRTITNKCLSCSPFKPAARPFGGHHPPKPPAARASQSWKTLLSLMA